MFSHTVTLNSTIKILHSHTNASRQTYQTGIYRNSAAKRNHWLPQVWHQNKWLSHQVRSVQVDLSEWPIRAIDHCRLYPVGTVAQHFVVNFWLSSLAVNVWYLKFKFVLWVCALLCVANLLSRCASGLSSRQTHCRESHKRKRRSHAQPSQVEFAHKNYCCFN